MPVFWKVFWNNEANHLCASLIHWGCLRLGLPVRCSVVLWGCSARTWLGESPSHHGPSNSMPVCMFCHVNLTGTNRCAELIWWVWGGLSVIVSWIISCVPFSLADQIATELKCAPASRGIAGSGCLEWHTHGSGLSHRPGDLLTSIMVPRDLLLANAEIFCYKDLDTGVEMCSADSWKKNKSPNTRWLTFWAYLTLLCSRFGSDLRFRSLMTLKKKKIES